MKSRNRVTTYAVRITWLIADIEDKYHGPRLHKDGDADASFHFRNSDKYYHDPEECEFDCCISTCDGQDWNVVSWKLHGSSGVHTLMTEAGLVIHMLVEKKYPLRKKVLLKILELKLESEEDSTMALELIRFVKKLVVELEPKNSDGDEKDL
ncbi:hypothetical protein Tco_0018362 [Tanacetum coccineum]